MFCGMGVCQDCLVTVDGDAEPARLHDAWPAAGMGVRTQVALPRLRRRAVAAPRRARRG